MSTVSLDAARVRAKMSAAQVRIASLAEQKRELTRKMEATKPRSSRRRKSSVVW